MEYALPNLRPPSRQHSPETQAQIAAIAARREARQSKTPRPAHWLKPSYGSTQYRYALGMGWISDEEHRADFEARQKRSQTAKESQGARSAPRRRENNPAPRETRQYGQDYGTEAIRDSRLTPNARNLLMLIRALCGKGSETSFTKGTMANALQVSPRSIQRYVQELARFGYIAAEVAKGFAGMHIGLLVRITEKVRPFHQRPAMLASWLKDETAKTIRQAARTLGFSGRTRLSPIKDSNLPTKPGGAWGGVERSGIGPSGPMSRRSAGF